MAFPVADSYSVGFGQSVNAGRSGVVAPAFEHAYERSSFTPTGSSIVVGGGVAGSLLVKMNPKPATDDSAGFMWMNAGVDIVGMLGQEPTFQFLQASIHTASLGVWPAGRCPMYSLDGGFSWQYFSSAGVKDTANDWIQWRHNAPFTQDKIRISESRAMSVHQHGTRIAALAAAYSFVQPTASSVAFTPTAAVADFAAQAFIAAEYAASTDNIGRTIPIQPFYAFQINDTSLVPASGSKKLWLINGGTHSGEDMGDYSMWHSLYWLCGNNAEAIQLRRDFRIVVYSCTTANGRAAGYGRGGTYNTKDPNRHMNVANSTPEVTVMYAATALDFAGAPLKIFFDFHGTYEGKFGLFGVEPTLLSKLRTISGLTITDYGGSPINVKTGWYKSAGSDGFVGAVTAATLELGDVSPVPESDLILFSESLMRAIYQMNQEGAYA